MRLLAVGCLACLFLLLMVPRAPARSTTPGQLQGSRPPDNETEAEGRFRLLRLYNIDRDYHCTRSPGFVIAEWKDAVLAHVPGEVDEAALKIADWTGDELDWLLVQMLFQVTATEQERFDHHLPPRDRVVALVKRGVVLHSDIALLLSSRAWSPVISLRTSPKHYYIVEYSDGRSQGGFGAGVHLEIGRALFSFLRRGDVADPTLESLWYQATAASLIKAGENGYAEPQLRVGLEALPGDARLLFYAGALHEAFAASRTQRGLEHVETPSGYTSIVASAGEELRRGEKLFARALRANPGDGEVRLHHGRVLGQLDRHADAAAELALVDGKLKDPELAYYAALFRGEEEAALGHRDAARDGFERAAALFPTAQSPLLALSRLARGHGDRAGAVAALRRVFALPTNEQERVDPWPDYDVSSVRDADALVQQLYARFRQRNTL